MTRRWCDDCGRTREVVDEFVEDTGDSRVNVEVSTVTVLDCDHHVQVRIGEYRSPLQQAGPPPRVLPDPFTEEG